MPRQAGPPAVATEIPPRFYRPFGNGTRPDPTMRAQQVARERFVPSLCR